MSFSVRIFSWTLDEQDVFVLLWRPKVACLKAVMHAASNCHFSKMEKFIFFSIMLILLAISSFINVIKIAGMLGQCFRVGEGEFLLGMVLELVGEYWYVFFGIDWGGVLWLGDFIEGRYQRRCFNYVDGVHFLLCWL